MGAARALTNLEVTGDGDGFSVRRKGGESQFEISSDSIQDGYPIKTPFIYGKHDPDGRNKHPHLSVNGMQESGDTCGVVIIHDTTDQDDWCHGVFIFEKDAEIEEDAVGNRIRIKRVIEGINDLNRNQRGDSHNTTQEKNREGIGYIGCYPSYDTGKSQVKQETHLYHFDGYEVQMTVMELLFAVVQITRKKLGKALLKGTANNHTKTTLMRMAVLTKENVEEVMAGHIINKSSFVGTYKNPGWLNGVWAEPTTSSGRERTPQPAADRERRKAS